MQHEERSEVDLSRRRFLKLGGLLGLALGALSLPSLGWTEPAAGGGHEGEEELWLEARKRKVHSKKRRHRKSKKVSAEKKRTSEGSGTNWQETA